MAKHICIHVWGGFGAKLSAYFVLLELKKRSSKYSYRIVAHEDPYFDFGYRQGERDLVFLNMQENLDTSFDYLVPRHLRANDYHLTAKVKVTLRRARSWIILNSSNRSREIKKFTEIKEISLDKTRHIRINKLVFDISDLEFRDLWMTLGLSAEVREDSMVAHWRLGDLYLRSKKDAGNLETFLDKLIEQSVIFDSQVTVYTDSPLLVGDLIKPIALMMKPTRILRAQGNNYQNFMEEAITARAFIGSQSKISLWIVAFRCSLNKHESTFIPASLLPAFNSMFPGLRYVSPITF
jgi:hypothetical protein